MKPRLAISLLVALACAAAAVLALGGVGGAGTGLDPAAQAAQATTRADGAKVLLSGSFSIAGVPQALTLDGEGSFNFAGHEGRFAFAVGGLPASVQARLGGSTLHMSELLQSGSLYLGSPAFDGQLPNGARWVRLDLASLDRAMGLDPSSLTSGGSDPAQYLRDLGPGAVSTRAVGRELVRGVATTHLSGTLDPLKAAEAQPGVNRQLARAMFGRLAAALGSRTIPIDVWVDAHHLIRRLALAFGSTAAGRPVQGRIDVEYFDFGPTAPVAAPPASEVLDMTGTALQGLTHAG